MVHKVKYLIIFLLLANSSFADIVISTDTTISGTWVIPSSTVLRFTTGGHIHGTAIINGGIIDAAYTQWIFDSSITVNPSGLYNRNFSAMWYGAMPSKDDNWYQIQTAITACINRWPLYIPTGNYNIKSPLYVYQIYNGVYVGCQIHIFGDANMWTPDFGTRINIIGNQPCFKLQLNKGTEINNITLTGQFRSPATTDSIYFNTPIDSFLDVSGKGMTKSNRGINIDYDTNQDGSQSGSTAIYIHDLTIRNFFTCIIGSTNGQTLNNDILRIKNIQIGDCNRGIVSTQGQEKGNLIDGLYCWASVHTLFSSGNDLNGQGGNYNITNLNVAGRVIRPFCINNNNWGRISISNGFFEQIGEIGTLNDGKGMSISNCQFDFAYPQAVGKKNLITSSGNGIAFYNCDFRYFGQTDTLNMSGRASFINCFFTGAIKNSSGINQITYPLPGTPTKSSVRLTSQ